MNGRALIEDARKFVRGAAEAALPILKIHESYDAFFNTPYWERVLAHILREAHVFDTTFVRGDPHETSLREGERRLALSILRRVVRDHKRFQDLAASHYNRTTDASST